VKAHRIDLVDIAVAFTLGLLVAVGLHGCASPMASARTAANTAADVANVGGDTVLSAYCAAEMNAQHMRGHWDGEHCRADATHTRTPEEATAVESVRTQWAPVIAAHDALAASHLVLVDVLNAADGHVDSAALLRAMGDIARAYEALREAAATVHVTLPAILGGSQ
jgi:hypothetical protein